MTRNNMISNNIALFTILPSDELTQSGPEIETLFTLPDPDLIDIPNTDFKADSLLSFKNQIGLPAEEFDTKTLLNTPAPADLLDAKNNVISPGELEKIISSDPVVDEIPSNPAYNSAYPLQLAEKEPIALQQSHLPSSVSAAVASGDIRDLEPKLIPKDDISRQIDNVTMLPKATPVNELENILIETKTDIRTVIPINYSILNSRLTEQVKLNVNLKEHFLNSPPVAGSLAPSSDKLIHTTPQISSVDISMSSFADQYQGEGKTLPPGGNNLPGNLPFLTSSVENALATDTVTDLMSKPVSTGMSGKTEVLINPQGTALLKTEASTSLIIESSAGSSDWNTQLGNKIRWMGSVNISSAELKLHPAELGALQIIISTEDEKTTVNFITNNNAAKEVIEASLPRLRDLLSSSGLQLEQSDVSQQNLSKDGRPQEKMNSKDALHENEKLISGNASLESKNHSNKQVDHYV